MKIIGTLDTKMLELVQEGYLWLWDRTGATVGMCIFPIVMPGVFFDTGNSSLWLRLLIGLLMTVFLFGSHVVQTESLLRHNAFARQWRDSFLRGVCLSYAMAALAINVITGHPVSFAFNLLNVLVAYLWCVQVRDREPPEKQAFARGVA